MQNNKNWKYLLLILILTTLVYSNHFHNPFYFDDLHVINDNIYIRSLSNTSSFFTDAKTFSPIAKHYRPLMTLSNAIDYHFAGGLNSFYFHLSMFLWYLVQLVLMYLMFNALSKKIASHKWDYLFVLFAVSWYAFHTVNAETLNYITSRSDSISTMFVIAAMYIYIAFPKLRRYHLYLIFVVLAILSKEQANMFFALLFFYILFFENKMSITDIFKKSKFKLLLNTFYKTLPAFIVCVLMSFLFLFMMRGGTAAIETADSTLGIKNIAEHVSIGKMFSSNERVLYYFLTQQWVYLRYFYLFFIPVGLSADTDWTIIYNAFDFRIIIGVIFTIALLTTAVISSKKEKTRPIAYGILWFWLSLLPTSSIFTAGATVTNDHRMFFPFVGLVFAVVWAIRLIIIKYQNKIIENKVLKYSVLSLAFIIISANAIGIRHRNNIWSSPKSLWYDVTVKSPNNGRGFLNYGLALRSEGNLKEALLNFEKSLELRPNNLYTHLSLGEVKASLGNLKEAEQHFIFAVNKDSNKHISHYLYSKFLLDHIKTEIAFRKAMHHAEKSLALAPNHLDTRHVLLYIYDNLKEIDKIQLLIKDNLRIYPKDSYTLQYTQKDYSSVKSDLEIAKTKVQENPSVDNFLNLAVQYFINEEYQKCIETCNKTIEIDPTNALAYSHKCSAYIVLENWELANESCKKALELNPNMDRTKKNLELIQNNLNN